MKAILLKAINIFLLINIAVMCLSLAFVNQALTSWWVDSGLYSRQSEWFLVWLPPMVAVLVFSFVVIKELRLASVAKRLMLNMGALLALFIFAYTWAYWSLLHLP